MAIGQLPLGNWQFWGRFWIVVPLRILTGTASATRLAGYSLEARARGNSRIASWCMSLAARLTTKQPEVYEPVFQKYLSDGEIESATSYSQAVFDACGMPLTDGARLLGELVRANDWPGALLTYDRLQLACKGDPVAEVPAPASRASLPLRSSLQALANTGSAGSAHESSAYLSTARLCFSFSAFPAAARLFQLVENDGGLPTHEDRISLAYAALRCAEPGSDMALGNLQDELTRNPGLDPDWLGLAATVHLACGDVESASAAIESAVRQRHPDSPFRDAILADTCAVIALLSSSPDNIELSGVPAEDDETNQQALATSSVEKIFVCGNGWSGSGALYDCLVEFENVATVPSVRIDRYINDCTDNEVMFVQGSFGLGRVFRDAKRRNTIDRSGLWDMYRVHVLGTGAIGFTEHKSANVAGTMLSNHGTRYSGIFRRLIESACVFDSSASIDDFRELMCRTTEELTRLITDVRANQSVVYNNAMFGPNLDMVEIFSNARLLVVARDPLDQYADRKTQDLKHWMTAKRFISFYKSSRSAFEKQRRSLPASLQPRIREIEFERFVEDSDYRLKVIHWAFAGANKQREKEQFDPGVSMRNIGIGKQRLTREEQQQLKSRLGRWQRS